MADSEDVNIVLVPALLLLLGLVVYKKVIEPRRAGESSPKPGKAPRPAKAEKAPKPGKPPKLGKAPKASKSTPMASSGRMGSVL